MTSMDKIKGHIAVITANIFFGLNVPITKSLISNGLTPAGYILIRVGFATALFWLIGLFTPSEKVSVRDIASLGVGGLFGVIGAQYLVGISLEHTSPIYFSLMSAMSPAIVMLLAALFLKEPVTVHKAVGVLIGIFGAIILIFNSSSVVGDNNLLGIIIALISVTSYAPYIIIIRSVATKYSSLTQMKWTYLPACLFLLPIAELSGQEPIIPFLSLNMIAGLSFIIIFVTVIGFMLVPYGLRVLRPTTVSVYTNLQPVVSSFVAIILGQDIFSWDKPIAGLLVMAGAYIVTTNPAKSEQGKFKTSI